MTVPLRILRKVDGLDASTIQRLRAQLSDAAKMAIANKDMERYAQLQGLLALDGYVDNDLPRDYDLTAEIIERTTGYAIAGMDGSIIRDGIESLVEAEAIRANARINVSYDVQLEDAGSA